MGRHSTRHAPRSNRSAVPSSQTAPAVRRGHGFCVEPVECAAGRWCRSHPRAARSCSLKRPVAPCCLACCPRCTHGGGTLRTLRHRPPSRPTVGRWPWHVRMDWCGCGTSSRAPTFCRWWVTRAQSAGRARRPPASGNGRRRPHSGGNVHRGVPLAARRAAGQVSAGRRVSIPGRPG